MALPNVIIAGPPKAGTTSVFRYLSAHPDVFPSSIKEVHFFTRFLDKENPSALTNYAEYFSGCEDETVRLEASPKYLQGGRPVAEFIHQHIPNAKIAFFLREPTERFLSRYKSLMTKSELIPKKYRELNSLVDACVNHQDANPNPTNPIREHEILEYIWQGCYASFIGEFLDVFPKEQIGLFFFDELSDSPKTFMSKFCNFSNIDDQFYNNFQFVIENRTRNIRFKGMHLVAEQLNRRFEGVQNRFPKFRRFIRDSYYSLLNPEIKQNQADNQQYAKEQLGKFYRPHNKALRQLLSDHYPDQEYPDWINH